MTESTAKKPVQLDLTPDEMKPIAEALSDKARRLLARLSERYESGLTLPQDQAAFDELAAAELAESTHGPLCRLTNDGRQVAAYLGPYREAIDPAKEPNLQPPADPAKEQEAIRKATEQEHAEAEKAAQKAERDENVTVAAKK